MLRYVNASILVVLTAGVAFGGAAFQFPTSSMVRGLPVHSDTSGLAFQDYTSTGLVKMSGKSVVKANLADPSYSTTFTTSGTTTLVLPTSGTVTAQGNTFNGNSQLVQLDSSGKMPAVDGSQLTNLPSAGMQLGGDIGGTLSNPKVVAINGTAISASPAAVWSNYVYNNSAATGKNSSRFTPNHAVTIVRYQFAAGTPASTCSTYPVLALYDATASSTITSITFTNGTADYDSGAISVNVPAGHIIESRWTTASASCTTAPAGVTFVVQYQMQ